MIDLKPREYQKKIFETASKANTLVVLPTGVGKTLIALLLSIDRLQKFPGSKVLFLAPTRPLVEQHLITYKKQLPELFASLEIFTGEVNAKSRKSLFDKADIIFSTPQCISNDLKSGLYNLEEVSLLIIDEAHRCLKNYSYTQVVDYYKRQTANQRILGLTASPGSELDKIKEICAHLNIKEIEIRNRESEDVKPYLQELEFRKIEVDFPEEFIELKVLFKGIYDSYISYLKDKHYLFGPPNKLTLLKLQTSLGKKATQKDFSVMPALSVAAQALKISHALELLETQALSSLNQYLRSLIQQANEQKSKGVQILVKKPEFQAALVSLNHLLSKSIEHPKISKVKELIDSELESNPKAKTIIFTQFRETATTIIENLKKNTKIKPEMFVGQAKKSSSTGFTGLNQKQQKQIIEKFKEGEINVLVATSIAEEGLDIPEVSAVIFYEPIPSAIRKIQRAGRTARLKPGKLIILITKDTRDVSNHYASAAREKKMYKTLDSVKRDLDSSRKNTTKDIREFFKKD